MYLAENPLLGIAESKQICPRLHSFSYTQIVVVFISKWKNDWNKNLKNQKPLLEAKGLLYAS